MPTSFRSALTNTFTHSPTWERRVPPTSPRQQLFTQPTQERQRPTNQPSPTDPYTAQHENAEFHPPVLIHTFLHSPHHHIQNDLCSATLKPINERPPPYRTTDTISVLLSASTATTTTGSPRPQATTTQAEPLHARPSRITASAGGTPGNALPSHVLAEMMVAIYWDCDWGPTLGTATAIMIITVTVFALLISILRDLRQSFASCPTSPLFTSLQQHRSTSSPTLHVQWSASTLTSAGFLEAQKVAVDYC